MNDLAETEKQIVGTFLQNKGTALVELLKPEDFMIFPETFRGIKRQIEAGQQVNMLRLHTGEKELNMSELAALVANVVSPNLIESHVNTLKSICAKRETERILKNYSNKLANGKEDIQELIADVVNDLKAIDLPQKNKTTTTADAFLDYLKSYDEREKNKGKEMTIGMSRFDRTTAGFHKGELTTIAARPGKGKTAFALQISTALTQKGYKVLFASLEMSAEQLAERLIVRFSGVAHQKLRNAELDRREWELISIAGDRISKDKFLIDTGIRTVADLRAAMIRTQPDIVIIDHVGRMKDTGRFESRRAELGSITRKLKLMTLDLGTPIIMLSQLNRDAQHKRPSLSELRESGAIEEDSDNVLLLHRLTTDDKLGLYGYDTQSFLDITGKGRFPSLLIIEKQRNGDTKDILTIFDPSKFMFIEVERQ